MLHTDTYKIIDLLNKHNIDISKIVNIRKNKYFMNLYDNIKKKIIKIENKDIDIKILNKNIEYYFKNNQFTSENIKNKIFNTLKYGYECIYKNNNIIYFCDKSMNKVSKIIIHMFQIIILLKEIFDKSDYHQHIIYFETNEKKKFPSKNIVLGPNEVNSGLTTLELDSKNKNGDIILYRKEEVLKVLIHELIHSNLIDSKIIFSNKTDKLNDLFCSNYKILLNEAFTESFATIIHIFYIHIINKMKKEELDIMFQNEMKYSIYICNKIINYYNIDHLNNILKKKNECTNYFPQKTNVLSYYILKNILLSNHILFANILNKYCSNYKINDENGIIEIIHLIMNNIHSFHYINKIKDKNNSLRLCLYEIIP